MPKKASRTRQRKAKDDLECDQELFALLAELRTKLAQEGRVPAYVIFGDRTLIEMAKTYPVTQEAMMRINGVGPVKWIKYGSIFLDAIKKHSSKRAMIAR